MTATKMSLASRAGLLTRRTLTLPLPLFTEVRGMVILRTSTKESSRKFGVASAPPSSAASAQERHSGTALGSKRTYLVAFVAPLCIKGLRLATLQLPENSCPIGPGLCRTSP